MQTKHAKMQKEQLMVPQQYYLPHPYKCDKYIWCFSSGDQGVEQPCAGDLMFNPQYKDNTDLCIAADAVTQCKQN